MNFVYDPLYQVLCNFGKPYLSDIPMPQSLVPFALDPGGLFKYIFFLELSF
jgi:hypothetical protein